MAAPNISVLAIKHFIGDIYYFILIVSNFVGLITMMTVTGKLSDSVLSFIPQFQNL